MSAHTPGPWSTYLNTPTDVVVRKMLPDGQEACEIARVKSVKAMSDARLIAAAPDGLIAGTDLLDVVKAAIRAGDWKVDGACDPDAAIRRMEQFIAKATGGPAPVVQMPPDEARRIAADLIAAADRIDSLSPTPPADPLAASLTATAGGDFSSEVTP